MHEGTTETASPLVHKLWRIARPAGLGGAHFAPTTSSRAWEHSQRNVAMPLVRMFR